MANAKWLFSDPKVQPEEWFEMFWDVSPIAKSEHAAALYAYELDDYDIKRDFDADLHTQEVKVKSPEGAITKFRLLPVLDVQWKVQPIADDSVDK